MVGMNPRSFSYVFGLLIGVVMLVLWQTPARTSQLIACDVGQGDAILIVKGSTQVLVDGGPSGEKVLACLEQYLPFWDRTLELVVLTNTDFDHMQGLSSVFERYQITQFVTSDGVHESQALSRFVEVLGKSQVPIVGVERGDVIKVTGEQELSFQVLWPPQIIREYIGVFTEDLSGPARGRILSASAERGDLNERSVVLLFSEGESQVLLMGDAGTDTEQSLLVLGGLPDIDILKVGHHGSKYASSRAFLEVVRPETAMISAGAHNRYGHPTEAALSRLKEVGAVIERTDLSGDRVIGL
jgi:competence protein ComEC